MKLHFHFEVSSNCLETKVKIDIAVAKEKECLLPYPAKFYAQSLHVMENEVLIEMYKLSAITFLSRVLYCDKTRRAFENTREM